MDLSFLEELAKEELRFKKFSLVGTGNVQAAGSLKAGYAVNVGVGAEEDATPTPPPGTGACCAEDGSCSITTEAGCVGTYQGDGTLCEPNPCAGGACCYSNGTCDNTHDESLCTLTSGYWHADGGCASCVGPCCIACEAGCTCTDGLTLTQCQDSRPEGCSSAWNLADTGHTCGSLGDAGGDFCCHQFGSGTCPNNCPAPCCGVFSGYLGMHTYETQDIHFTGGGGTDNSYDEHQIIHFDADCNEICSGGGTCTAFDGSCSTTWVMNSDCSITYTSQEPPGCTCIGLTCGDNPTSGTTSDSTRFEYWDCDDGGFSHIDYTLSDICDT
jgi:hypothetical protein